MINIERDGQLPQQTICIEINQLAMFCCPIWHIIQVSGRMEFTEIQQLDKLMSYSRRNDVSQRLSSQDTEGEQIQFTVDSYFGPTLDNCAQSIAELLKQIDMYAMSMLNPLPTKDEQPDFRIKAQTEYQMPKPVSDESDDLLFLPKAQQILRGSAAIRGSTMIRDSVKRNPYLKQESTIRIFYFGKPTCKTIIYNRQTTVLDLIEKAIFQYLEDPKLDKQRIKTTKAQAYTLRLLEDQQTCSPDLLLQPLDYSRKIAQMNFQALALMPNTKVQVEFSSKQQQLINLSKEAQNVCFFRVIDQDDEQLFCQSFDASDNVEAIISQVLRSQKYLMDKFYLSQGRDEDLELDPMTILSKLDSKRLFIKVKKFADEPPEEAKQLKARSTIDSLKKTESKPQEKEPEVIEQKYNLMTETNASKYEQFTVVKVNTWGIRQNRVLGIDQNKIYNYDQSVHSNQKQVSLFSKMLGKSNFGTKTPQRLIRDILSMRQVTEKNLIIIECRDGDKKKYLQFQADPTTRFRILQKLEYLIKLQSNIKN